MASHDVLARQAAGVGVRRDRIEDLGRDHDLRRGCAKSFNARAEHLLADAVRIHVGGVEEVDAAVERVLDHGAAFRLASSTHGRHFDEPNDIVPRHRRDTFNPVFPRLSVVHGLIDLTTCADAAQRWFPILALVAVATMVNYLDRTVLGIAAPYLTKELGLTAASLGIVFSAFSWSYALLQIPGGVFLDRFGTRITYSLALGLWSAFTAMMGLSTASRR